MIARIRQLLARLHAFGRGAALDREFAQEIASHLEMLTEDNVRRGMSPADARRQAVLRLGATSSLQAQHRDVRGFRPLEDLFHDLRFAARLLFKERWFTAAAIAAIALGIGANAVGFTIVNAAFFRGFGFDQADQLHVVSWRPERGLRARLSFADYEDWRSQVRSFSDLAAYNFGAVNISDDHAPPEQTQGAWVTANHFEVLRQRTLLGRGFAPGEDRRGAARVVIIGYQIWTNRFARDPRVIGRILRVDGQPATIVGVMPERMKFPENAELWMPFVPTDAQLARDARVLGVFGRLAPGVTRREAETEVEGVARRVVAANPDDTTGLVGGHVETLVGRFLGGAARPMFITVMGAVVFVLLIACANVANLLLSRATFRGREVAVRYALGATRWRVVRQLLIESILLSSLGGAVGLVLAMTGVRLFDAAVQQSQPPYWLIFTIDYRVLAYVAGVCVATGMVFGLAPALQVSRENQQATLKEGARGTAGSRRAGRFGAGLVVGELALTVVLLCGAGLMLRSFIALYAIDPGFDTDGLTRMRMQLPPSQYPTDETRRRFFDQLAARLDALPGVERAALATSVPPLDDEEWRFEIDGRQYPDDGRRPWVATVTVTAPYFDVLGVAMVRGRALTETDGSAGAEHVVISRVMADREFAGEDPIGRRIRFVPRDDQRDGPPQPWRTIVGVSAPFLQGSSDEAFRSAVVYLPLRQSPPRTASILIRSPLPSASVMRSVQEVVQSIDPDQPVFTIQTMAESFNEERIIYRIFATLFAVLAAIGLTLSAVGVYGVMAYAVSQRRQEIGVRMAIGAQRWQVSWLFMRRALVQVGLGLAIGLPTALALAGVVRFRLVAIEPNDPVTFFAITAVALSAALPACVLPVLRAAKIDPVAALRTE